MYLNLQISQSVVLDCASHISRHFLCTLEILPRQKQGLMHLFDSSKSVCKHILQTPCVTTVNLLDGKFFISFSFFSFLFSDINLLRLLCVSLKSDVEICASFSVSFCSVAARISPFMSLRESFWSAPWWCDTWTSRI